MIKYLISGIAIGLILGVLLSLVLFTICVKGVEKDVRK